MSMLSRVALICLLSTPVANAADFDFIFGAGFDNTTPMAPEGGNPATTLGEARRNVLIEAGRVWGSLLVSNVRIVVRAQFVDTQECTATTGTLASAGATNLFRNFTNAPPNTFFVSALANAIAGRDLNTANADINVNINSKVNGSAGCLSGRRFYYGFDHNTLSITPRGIDLLAVALHEFAHGFGFASEIDLTGDNAGETIDSSGAVTGYVQQIFDEQLGRAWPLLSPAERVQSATRTGFLAWNGSRANAQAARFPGGITSQGRFQLNAPATLDEGSSVSHWSPAFANPNLLMEPNISSTLTSIVDVTPCALQDIGWQVTRCPDAAGPPSPNAPTATGQTVSLIEDTSVVITLMATDPDANTTLTFIPTAPGRGVLTGNTAMRTYTPNANASGQDSFTFTASDGANFSAPATVMINITPVNDPPTAGSFIIGAGSGQSAAIPLQGSDPDPDGFSFEVLTMPANGTLTGVGNPVLTYVSNNGFVGADSFTYRTRDASTVSATATVTINVVALATPPPTTPAPGGRGGGGGAMNELLLLALGLLALTARLYKRRAAALQSAR